MDTKEKTERINQLLHVCANYMTRFAGDILLSYNDIMSTLNERKEIEVYLAKTHFDTENRFIGYRKNGSEEVATTLAEARKSARDMYWGDYILTIYDKGDYISVGIENNPNEHRLLPPFYDYEFSDSMYEGIKMEFDHRNVYTVDDICRYAVWNENGGYYEIELEKPMEFKQPLFTITSSHIRINPNESSFFRVMGNNDRCEIVPFDAEIIKKIRAAARI